MKRTTHIVLLVMAVILISCKSSGESTDAGNSVSGGIEMEDASNDKAMIDNEQTSHWANNSEEELRRMSGVELVGQWKWVQTICCGRTSQDIFPKEGEADKIISFDADGKAVYFTGDREKSMAGQAYSIGALGEQATVRIGEHPPAIFWVSDDGNELSLSWGYMDLQIEYYHRVK